MHKGGIIPDTFRMPKLNHVTGQTMTKNEMMARIASPCSFHERSSAVQEASWSYGMVYLHQVPLATPPYAYRGCHLRQKRPRLASPIAKSGALARSIAEPRRTCARAVNQSVLLSTATGAPQVRCVYVESVCVTPRLLHC